MVYDRDLEIKANCPTLLISAMKRVVVVEKLPGICGPAKTFRPDVFYDPIVSGSLLPVAWLKVGRRFDNKRVES